MAHILERREVGRHYDADFRNLVIVTETVWAKWNNHDKQHTRTTEKLVPLTRGEREHLLAKTTGAAR